MGWIQAGVWQEMVEVSGLIALGLISTLGFTTLRRSTSYSLVKEQRVGGAACTALNKDWTVQKKLWTGLCQLNLLVGVLDSVSGVFSILALFEGWLRLSPPPPPSSSSGLSRTGSAHTPPTRGTVLIGMAGLGVQSQQLHQTVRFVAISSMKYTHTQPRAEHRIGNAGGLRVGDYGDQA